MIQCIDTLGLREAIVHVLLHIEAVHVDESRRFVSIEELLLERVAVLPVVDDHLAVSCADKPLVVRFQERNIEAVQGSVQADQVLN